MASRHYSLADRLIMQLERTVTAIYPHSSAPAQRPNPSTDIAEASLALTEKNQAAALMRINHAGEICAQALYHGQAVTSKALGIQAKLQQAASEEADHLAWCQQRLRELDSHASYLAPLWYSGSWLLGAFVGLWPESVGLGFIVATEQQVVAHLDTHLQRLPQQDTKSRQILLKMREDEHQHATQALAAGAMVLPWPIQCLMRSTAKVMTTIAYWV